MERQLLIVLTVILMTAGCQQLPVNGPNTTETSDDIPTEILIRIFIPHMIFGNILF